MRLSYQWLTEVVDLTDVTPQLLAEKLTNAGIAVDAIEPRAAVSTGLVVGKVIECNRHPDADRLNVCKVDVGTGDLLTIVCGAPNVAAGQKVPTALVGATLPGGKIGKAKLRGVESEGMLCSAQEIGLETKWLPKDQTTGLFLLPEDTPVGVNAVEILHLDDTILELDLTPNRADCMSLRGLAYEVSAILGRPLRFQEVLDEGQAAGASPVKIELETALCTRYDAQVMNLKGVVASPLWMQMRLLAMGVRPISLIVDVTNYVMLEWGQPLHAFDLDQVRQQTIRVRQGHPGETITTLDGEQRLLTEETVVIADVERAIGIAGVMGGENSEITDGTGTIIIESAAFDAVSVRRTGQRLGLRSEAQQRFEKGIDSVAVRGALVRATQLLESLGQAVRTGPVVSVETGIGQFEDRGHLGSRPGKTVDFRVAYCNELLGTDIPAAEMKEIFSRLGFHVEEGHSAWKVWIPTRRPDISIEADLVEEIGRLHGLDEIPSTLMRGATAVGVRTPWQQFRLRTKEVLIGLGFNEVFTYTFSHPKVLDALRVEEDSVYGKMIPLLHPISEERTVLRTHMLPGLAAVARYNLARGVEGGQIFEMGRVYWPESLPLQKQPTEQTQLAMAWFGQQEAGYSQSAAKRGYDFYDGKGTIETWLESIGLAEDAEFVRANVTWLHPGRSAAIQIGNEVVGTFGELHPETADALDVGQTFYAEFNLERVFHFMRSDWKAGALPRYPSSRRDLAVVVDNAVEAGELLSTATQAVTEVLPGCLETSQVFDVYTGEHVAVGTKSVAIALTFRAQDRTLTDDEVDSAISRILDLWKERYGAELRA